MKRKDRLIADLELVLLSQNPPPQTEKSIKETIAFLQEHNCIKTDTYLGRIILSHIAKEMLSKFIE